MTQPLHSAPGTSTATTGPMTRWCRRPAPAWRTTSSRGLEAAATSQKTELKLTNVAKASQEELLFDYQTFLRQHNLPEWLADSPESLAVRQTRPADLDQLRNLMAVLVSDRSDKSDKSDRKAEVAANVMICLINQETFLLGRQLARLEQEFVEEGGFTERLYRVRSARRSEQVE